MGNMPGVTMERVDRALAAAPFLSRPVVQPWAEDARLFVQRGAPWVLLPAESDPLRTVKGGTLIPRRAMRDLQRVAEAGVDFDRLAIAHEVDPTRLPPDLAAQVPAHGLPCDAAVVKRLVGTSVPAPAAAVKLASALDKSFAALTTGTAAALAGLAGAADLDPIIFGVLGLAGRPRPGQPAAFFPLTAWRW